MASRIRAEWVLLGGVVLSVLLLPVHITTAYSGLPAHPLLLHVPVILIPVSVVWAIVLAVRPSLFERQGVWVAAIAVVGLIGLVLTMGAGSALRNALHLQGSFGPAVLVHQHQHAADLLRLCFYAFVLVLIALVASYRGLWLKSDGVRMGLRVVLVLLAIGSGYLCFHTGDLGAKAVWQGRLNHGGGGFPGGGRFVNPGGPNQPQLFGPG
jgi:hypothetical protein